MTTKEKAASPCQGEAAHKVKPEFDHNAHAKRGANLINSDGLRWKARQRSPRPILGMHRCGGRFLP